MRPVHRATFQRTLTVRGDRSSLLPEPLKLPLGDVYRPLPMMVPLPPRRALASVDVKTPTPEQFAVPLKVEFTRVKVPGVAPEELNVPFCMPQTLHKMCSLGSMEDLASCSDLYCLYQGLDRARDQAEISRCDSSGERIHLYL